LSLATRLYLLVAALLIASAFLQLQSMQQVKGTESVLKYTIDNRMISVQELQKISDALQVARDASRSVVDKAMTPDEARAKIRESVDETKESWDKYFLAEMIEQEQKLADET